jgi:hypothetical protein
VTGTVYGNPKTFGQQAELNAKRLGSELYQKMWDPALQPERKYTGPLPPGASLARGTGETPPWRDGSLGGQDDGQAPGPEGRAPTPRSTS